MVLLLPGIPSSVRWLSPDEPGAVLSLWKQPASEC